MNAEYFTKQLAQVSVDLLIPPEFVLVDTKNSDCKHLYEFKCRLICNLLVYLFDNAPILLYLHVH